MKIKSLNALNGPNRSSAIDFYRGIATLSVVVFHFEPFFPLGYLGVDLFFVISGFLVGGILIEKYKKGRINYWEFILQRGFKIWPSFYFFIILGNIIAYFLYHNSHHDAYIPFHDLKRYLLFYRNYTGIPNHWNFDHIWSLCVEEHFYILFPLALIVLLNLSKPRSANLYFLIVLMIVLGFVFKTLTLYYTNGKDTTSPTHNKIDALAYGILLYQLIMYFKEKPSIKGRFFFTILGALLLALSVMMNLRFHNSLYGLVIFPSIVPLFFALIIFGTYQLNFRKFKIIRFIAYYSYNFYLWHPLLIYFTYSKFGTTLSGFCFYLISSFIIAIISTILVEEFFLTRRKLLIARILKRHNRTNDS